ncbi:SWF or SNF family helicase [Streptomyces sp. NPDC014006]|uniref:SWIM zinc finger family protein n=1 Tax=Streptomyces sp. NPDC014006 TaxID=3364870 RepID=UPI003700C401
MNRQDEATERVFAALPPVQGRAFARTWWGLAWLKALEDTALDTGQVKTGRRLARAGAVGAVSVRPGRLTAVVRDRDGIGYRADVLLAQLAEDAWDRLLAMAVERAGHVAALLEREMPPHLVEDAAHAGVDLLPGIGDLEPQCECGAWDHCGHTAALCHQVARLLDEDPFVLLLMRGRSEGAVLEALQSRDTAPAREPEGVDAAEAFAAGAVLPPLPVAPELPEEPGQPPSLDSETAGPDPAALEFLAARAADAAHRLLAQALSSPPTPADPELTAAEDAVRLAAGEPGPEVARRLAAASGRSPQALDRAALAWRLGGAAGLSALEEEWTVRGEALARARAALDAAWEDDERPPLKAEGNRWTVTDAQVRLGRDGRWWPFRRAHGHWVPAGPPATDPATALMAARSDGPAQAHGSA